MEIIWLKFISKKNLFKRFIKGKSRKGCDTHVAVKAWSVSVGVKFKVSMRETPGKKM